jgi:hypothetical protein
MATVWYDEIDAGLKAEIQRCVRLAAQGGGSAPVPVCVRKPDEDFKIESYPSATIYNTHTRRSEYRQNRYENDLEPVRDMEARRIAVPLMDVPYDAFYQLDFWSLTNADMNRMTDSWIRRHAFRQFNLPVVNRDGEEESVLAVQTEGWVKSDALSGTSRLFHQAARYKIQAYVDPRGLDDAPMVETVEARFVRG